MTDELKPLTDEQVQNWRNMLCQMFGPYAFSMSRQEIELHRIRMQQDIDAVGPSHDEISADVQAGLQATLGACVAQMLRDDLT